MIIYSNKTCPWCFERFNAADVNFRCNTCKKVDDPILHSFWQESRIVGPPISSKDYPTKNKINFNNGFEIFGTRLASWEKIKCPKCGDKAYLMICPKCHNRVPNEMVKNKSYIISIVGARSSGKTIYITTLIDELKRRGMLLDNMGISAVNIADDPKQYTSARYEAMYKSLYEQKKTPEQTQINDKNSKVPLIYELSRRNRKSIYLVFYDTAGENFNDINKIADNVKFLKESDAVIFLLDTFQVPYVHNALGLTKVSGDLRYDAIFDNILGHFKEGDPDVRKSYFKKPMAFVFSKIDAILNNEKKFEETSIANMSMEKNSYFLSGDGVLLSEFDSISTSIMGALNAWGESNFINNVKNNYKNAKYFGISALGDEPKGTSVSKVSPYRVLDPLVWILNELKYQLPIKVEGGR